MTENALKSVKVFAPASISNIGPGFDAFGMAMNHPGDMVIARLADRDPAEPVRIISIVNDNETLPIEAHKNTAGVAAMGVLKMIGGKHAIDLEIYKGMPNQSGLGSSAASACAAAQAVNILTGGLLSKEELIDPCLDAEAAACGAAHADNVAPSMLGGFTVIRQTKPLVVDVLDGMKDLHFVLLHPSIEIATRDARAALPKKVEIPLAAHNWSRTAMMGYAFAKSDLDLFCECIDDAVVEPHRAKLVPGYDRVRKAALNAGALASCLSGSGPTMLAIVEGASYQEAVATAMMAVLREQNIAGRTYSTTLNTKGTVAITER